MSGRSNQSAGAAPVADPGARYPLVSVIIPNYNYAHTIGLCLKAVQEQTYPAIEIVVVDDGSTDGSPEVAAQYDCRVIRTQNRGVSAARNLGVARSRGEILFFIDSDIALRSDAVALAVEQLQADPQTAAVCGVYDTEPLIDDGVLERYKVLHGYFWRARSAGEVHMMFFSLAALRRSAYDAVGPLDERLRATEDVEYGARLTAHHRMTLRPDILGRHDDDDQWGVLLNKQFTRSVPLVALFLQRGQGRPRLRETAYRPMAVAATLMMLLSLAALPLGWPAAVAAILSLSCVCLAERRLLFFVRSRAGVGFVPVFLAIHLVMNTTTGLAAAFGAARWLTSATFRRQYRQPSLLPVRSEAGASLSTGRPLATSPGPTAAQPSVPRRWSTRAAIAWTVAWAAFVTGHLLASGRWPPWVLTAIVPPLAFPVGAVAVALAALAIPGRRRLLSLGVAILTLALAGPRSGFQVASNGARPAASPAGAVRVVSWNTEFWGQGAEQDHFYRYLKELNADVYLLQEYIHFRAGQIWAIDELPELRRRFPGYEIRIKGELVTLSRLPIVAVPQVDDPSILRVDLQLGDRSPLAFYNVHVVAPFDPGASPFRATFYETIGQRARERAHAYAVLEEAARSGLAAVIAGDLNTTPAMGEVQPLRQMVIDAAWKGESWYPTSWNEHMGVPALWRLDWAFTHGAARASGYRLEPSQGISDHRAQIFAVSLAEGARHD